MTFDCVLAETIQSAQHLQWHRYDLNAAKKVVSVRPCVLACTVQSALQRSSYTRLPFMLHAVELVIADQSRTDREMIRQLRDILNNPQLTQAVGPQNSPFRGWH